MEISKAWLKDKSACEEGVVWFSKQKETDGLKVVKELIKQNKLSCTNWLLPRIMDYKDYVSYAVYAAEQVINIYKKKYPTDKRPRKAIEAAKACINNPSEENKKAAAAYAAAYAAAAAVAYAADVAAHTAAHAAAYAAYAAAYAAAAADDVAAYVAAYAADAADARKEMQLKILQYGIKLLGAK